MPLFNIAVLIKFDSSDEVERYNLILVASSMWKLAIAPLNENDH